ncbi:MAG TPA: hypothetical protein VHM01_11715 [Alphaproteobacteria bacterium]|nr:hypothetical protein [Alphaproteobacteria bacterium]
MTFTFRRRWFLGLMTLFALFGRAGGARAAAAVVARPQGLSAELLHVLPRSADASVIGGEYLAAYPAEADIGALTRHFDELAGAPDGLHAAISRRLRRDFEERDTVRLRGWVLSRSEARLFAICALLEADRARTLV